MDMHNVWNLLFVGPAIIGLPATIKGNHIHCNHIVIDIRSHTPIDVVGGDVAEVLGTDIGKWLPIADL